MIRKENFKRLLNEEFLKYKTDQVAWNLGMVDLIKDEIKLIKENSGMQCCKKYF